jgi:hypothetical protein
MTTQTYHQQLRERIVAAGMEPQGLHDDFSATTSFCGGVDAQNLLVNGTPRSGFYGVA